MPPYSLRTNTSAADVQQRHQRDGVKFRLADSFPHDRRIVFGTDASVSASEGVLRRRVTRSAVRASASFREAHVG